GLVHPMAHGVELLLRHPMPLEQVGQLARSRLRIVQLATEASTLATLARNRRCLVVLAAATLADGRRRTGRAAGDGFGLLALSATAATDGGAGAGAAAVRVDLALNAGVGLAQAVGRRFVGVLEQVGGVAEATAGGA